MAENKKPKLTPVFNLLQSAIGIWWKNLKKFLMIYVWTILYALIPLALLVIMAALSAVGALSQSIAFWAILFFLGFWSFTFIIYFLVRAYLAMFLLLKHDFKRPEKEVYQESAQYFWSYLALMILTIILLGLWFLALVIPAIIFGVFYMFTCYAFIFEDKRDIDAVKRSYDLVKGYWWAVFGRVIFLGLIFWLFGLVIASPLRFFSSAMAFSYVWTGFMQVVNILVGPISLLLSYLIFQDLVKIKK